MSRFPRDPSRILDGPDGTVVESGGPVPDPDPDRPPPPYVIGPGNVMVASDTITASGATTLITAPKSARIRVVGWLLSNANTADVTANLRLGSSTDFGGAFLLFYGGMSHCVLWPLSLVGSYGEDLSIVLSASGSVIATVWYLLEPRPEVVR